jgi:hypothetical protein
MTMMAIFDLVQAALSVLQSDPAWLRHQRPLAKEFD